MSVYGSSIEIGLGLFEAFDSLEISVDRASTVTRLGGLGNKDMITHPHFLLFCIIIAEYNVVSGKMDGTLRNRPRFREKDLLNLTTNRSLKKDLQGNQIQLPWKLELRP